MNIINLNRSNLSIKKYINKRNRRNREVKKIVVVFYTQKTYKERDILFIGHKHFLLYLK